MDLANKRIVEIAQQKKEKLDLLTTSIEKAMVNKRTRFELARAIAQIILLTNK